MDEITCHGHGFAARLRPDCGGLVTALTATLDGRVVPLLHAPPEAAPHPATANFLGLWPLVPFANRAFGAVMRDGDRRIDLPVNDPDAGGAIHGFGWQAAWDLARAETTSVTLRHRRTAESDPYAYSAELRLTFQPGIAEIALGVTNEAPEALPFGIGLHPWFPRDTDTTVRCRAGRALAIGAGYRPHDIVGSAAGELDFAEARRLPDDREVLASLIGSEATAEIVYPGRGLRLVLDLDPELRHPVIWSPAGAPFLCVEPQSHAIGAPSEAFVAEATPLARLAPGERLGGALRLRPETIRYPDPST